MERREFLRQAAVGAAGLMLPETGKEIVDSRLTQKVTCAFKATALSDLCERLRTDTGIHLAAGNSVADEKVTLFCAKTPLREVMRQLSRPFGYTWLRSKSVDGRRQTVVGGPKSEGVKDRPPTTDYRLPTTVYRYELVQDLRSQLLEEELRNRDWHAALLALEKEMEQYRPYLDLSPEEALARSRSAPPGEKKLLEQLAINGWGGIQMYFRLSPQQMAALRAGQALVFSADPQPGELPLPQDLERGILQSQPNRRLIRREDGNFDLRSASNLDDLIEIAQLSDAQLDGADMAEGAREYWGLAEWDLVSSQPGGLIRPHLRALAEFTPAQRQEMLSPGGLAFARMSLAQQQKFIGFALQSGSAPLQSLDELAGATLRVKYTQPGSFEWRPPGPWWLRYVVPLEFGKRVPLAPIQEKTREAALASLHGVDPQIREAILQACHRADPRADTTSWDEATQIIPTTRELAIIYTPDSTNRRPLRVSRALDGNSTSLTW